MNTDAPFPVVALDPALLARTLFGQGARVLLFGAPGVGKSTLAAQLAAELSRAGRSCACISADPGSPLFGMPGHPTSCLMNSYLFLLPVIRKMARLPGRRGDRVEAKLGRRVLGSVGRKQFLTVRLEGGVAHPVFKKSGAITSMANADGYIVLHLDLDVIEAGEEVTVTLLG